MTTLRIRNPFSIEDLFGLDQNEDPRVGSGRNDSDGGGTLSATSGSKGSSLSKLGATFIPISIYVAVCLIIFFILRRRWTRVYAPRTIPALRAPEPPSPALPDGWFNWVVPFFKIPDTVVLNHGSLDGFFFLRYIKVLRNICFVGCCITWPILFPIHATGGNGKTELELLTIGNVVNPLKLYAHAGVAWLLFGFVLFTVARESIYYVNLRQAYLSSPYYSQRLSSRTVLFTNVPDRYLDQARIRKLYGDSVKRVWVPRTSKGLVNLVKEREQTAMRLEKAEMELIRKVNTVRNKHLREGEKREEKKKKKKKMRFPGNRLRRRGSPDPLVKVEEGEGQSTATDGHGPEVVTSRAVGDGGNRASIAGSGHTDSVPTTRRSSETESSDEGLPFTDATETIITAEEDRKSAGDDASSQTGEKDAVTEQTETVNPERQRGPATSPPDPDDIYVHPYGLTSPIPDVRGSVAAQWIPAERRPHHRPLGNFGRRVDTIRWTRMRLIELNKRISKLRRQVLRGAGKETQTIPAVFVEFDTQEAAQAAHQILAHHQPLHMAPRLLGIRPDEVVWSTLRIGWLERIVRRFAILGLIVAAIVFWSIPSAIVGIISNIDQMSDIIFLRWIKSLPGPITGFLTGFVPAIVLSLFMALVPHMLRFCAEVAGAPSINMVELFTQTAYFAFQVVQVFLITTLTSAASSAITDVLLDPLKVKDLLASNLPSASNFYISYILIQCLANAGTAILHPIDILRHAILGRIAQLPRSHYRLWNSMRPTRWGRDFPVFTNLGVIALSYACIAPLILIFAAVGMWFTHIVWRYNLIFVLDSDIDSKGLFYPRALMHLIVGLYLAEICLIGLFFLNGGTGPGVIIVLLLVFTALTHFSIHQAMSPMVQNLPQTLALEEEVQEEEKAKAAAARARAESGESNQGAANAYFDEDEEFGDAEDDIGALSDVEPDDSDDHETPDPIGNRALEGADDFRTAIGAWFRDFTKSAAKEQIESMGFKSSEDKYSDDDAKPPGVITRWLRPHIHEDFIAIRKNLMKLPASPPETHQDRRHTYLPPEMWQPKPVLWIPSDEARVSRQEVAHTRKSTPISDVGARIDENGRVVVDVEAAPFALPRLLM